MELPAIKYRHPAHRQLSGRSMTWQAPAWLSSRVA